MKKFLLIFLSLFLGYLTAFYTKPKEVKKGLWDFFKAPNFHKKQKLFKSSSDSLNYQIAKNLLEKYYYNTAYQKFDILWQKGNKNDSVSLGIAQAAYGIDSLDWALNWIDTTLKLNKKNYEALTLKSIIARNSADYESANNYANHALYIKKDYVPALVQLAFAQYYLNSTTEDAKTTLLKAKYLNPNYAESYYLESLISFYNGDTTNGLALLDTCIVKDTNFTYAYAAKGYILLNATTKEKLYEAIDCYKTALSKPKALKHIYNLNIGYIYSKLENNDSTLFYYKKSMQAKPDYYLAYQNTGFQYYTMNEPKKALKYFNLAIKYKQDCVEAYIYRGLIFYNNDDYVQALNDFYSALEYAPDNAYAIYNIALTQDLLGNTSDALEMFKKVRTNYSSEKTLRYANKRIKELQKIVDKNGK